MPARRCLAAVIPVLVGVWPLSALAMGGATPSAPAKGDAKVRCAAAYEQAQELRRQEKLMASRSELLICEETCPRVLVTDCRKWQSEIDALMPTVLLRAVDAQGNPVDARVLLDGTLFLDRWSEAPLSVDAGDHTFRFESASGLAQDVRVSLHTAERGHVIKAVLAPASVQSPPTGAAGTRPIPGASYGLGAVGAATLGLAGVLTLAGHVQVGHLRSTCALPVPHCSASEVDTVAAIYDIAWVSAGVGVAALAAALIVWRPWQSAYAAETPGPGAGHLFVKPTYGGALVGFDFP
jgi:hypothetical protein